MAESNSQLTDHADQVWRTVMRILNNEDDARECYQEVFVDAMRLDSANVRSWKAVMCQIATRRAMDCIRRKYRERNRREILKTEIPSEAPPDEKMIHEELRASVRAVLATLPAKQAEAFWLRNIEKLSVEEVACQLSVSSGHVRVLTHRAVVRLRDALGPTYANFGVENENA